MILEKTRLVLEAGARPIIAVYADADVDNAARFLFASGLLEPGQICAASGVCPVLAHEQPRADDRRIPAGYRLIRDVDAEAKILVCSAGRASSYLVTLLAMAGLHIRVGMEDTVWRWPHRPEKLESNLQAFQSARTSSNFSGARSRRRPSTRDHGAGLRTRLNADG